MNTPRAYRDPALAYPLGRSGTWRSALEIPVARGHVRKKRVYLHNPTNTPILLQPQIQGSTSGFAVTIPSGVTALPGVSSFEIEVAASGSVPLPTARDFAISTVVAGAVEYGEAPFSDMAHSDFDHTLESGTAQSSAFHFEVTVFALASADERFGDLGTSPLRSVGQFADYIASGMGFVDLDYRDSVVNFMADQTYDLALWAVNKHYLLDPLYSPMRLAPIRASSIGYDPPVVPSLPPPIRRRVYSRAFDLARKLGSAAGIQGIFQAIGVPLAEVAVWRDGFVWYVRVPQWVAAAFGLPLLAQLALYHIDPYCVLDLATVADTMGNIYSEFDYTLEASAPLAGGFLFVEDGVSYLLLEDGSKIVLES